MADRRRIVTRSVTGAVTTVLDLEDGSTLFAERGTFRVDPGTRSPTWAPLPRRYSGARAVGDSRPNATIQWTALVKGATAAAAIGTLGSLLGILEAPRSDLWFEWRPDGSANSVYYEIRGPAQWTAPYDWALFAGARMWRCELQIPVAPLAETDPYTQALGSTALPATVTVNVLSEAPALVDVTLRGTNNPAPAFALFSWAQTPTGAGGTSPFGIFEAEDGTLTTFASTGEGGARGGSLAQVTTSGAAVGAWSTVVDLTRLAADDWTATERVVDVWTRYRAASTVVNPQLLAYVTPQTTVYGPDRQSDNGNAKRLVTPSSGSSYRFARVGSLPLPLNPGTLFRIGLVATWDAGSSGVFGIDYVLVAASSAQALSPTGKPLAVTYPKFMLSTSDTTKTIRGRDLSGWFNHQGSFAINNPGSGLGGSLIEMPNGANTLLMKLSSLSPEDPTADTTSEATSHTVTGTFTIWPRFYAARA